MRRLAVFTLTVWLGLGASAIVLGQKGKGGSDVPVVAAISDADAGVAPLLTIQSDGGGPYLNSSTLKSIISNTGVWALNTLNWDTTRGVTLLFTDPIPGTGLNGGDPIAPPSGVYGAHLYSSCNHLGVNPLAMAAGQVITCPMGVEFEYGGKNYIIHMTQGEAHPQTNPVHFVCTSGSPCSSWQILPTVSDGAVLRNRASLSTRTTVKGKTVVTQQGDFYMSFSISLTK